MRKLKLSELNRAGVEEFKRLEKTPMVIVLDNIRSMHNIGSVFRTADSFRLAGIYLCGITATPPHREIEKTALGATASVEWKYFGQTAEAVAGLKAQGYRVLAVEQAEGSIYLDTVEAEPGARYALVFGNEVRGVEEEVMQLVDGCIEIPQYGTKHSLNISVSVGIVVWQLFQKGGWFRR